MFYLLLDYDLPVGTPPEFIGPFDTTEQAFDHQFKWGPEGARVICALVPPVPPVTSPEQHIAYSKERF